MVSPLFYYQLALLALVWLFVLLHVTWSTRGVTPPPASAQPAPLPRKRTRAHEPKPFAGLTHKPPCALCERDAAHPQAPLPGIHVKRDNRWSIAYSEELIVSTSATLQSTDRHHGIVGQER